MIQTHRAVLARPSNAAKNSLRCFRTELGQLRETSVARRRLERFDRLDAELLMDESDLGRAQRGQVEHLEQPFGQRLAQLLEVSRLTGFHEIANDGERGRPESAN